MMNKIIPDYYITKDNLIFYLIFLFFFSLFFVNVFTPFEGAWYDLQYSTRAQLFTYTLLIVSGGILILSLSSIFLYNAHKRKPLNYLQYWSWKLSEVIIIAFIYAIVFHYFVGDSREFSEIFVRSLIYVPLIMILPQVISLLYFSIKAKDEQISMLSDFAGDDFVLDNHITGSSTVAKDVQTAENKIVDETEIVSDSSPKAKIVNFFDDKDELQLSLRIDHIYYIESSENYVHIYYSNKGQVERFILRSSLKRQLDKLEKFGFLRTHKSYIVNFNNILLMRKDKDGPYLDFGVDGVQQIPISKTYLESVTQYFIQNSEE